MSALISYDSVEGLDGELVRLGRGVAALRLRVGEALEALARSGGHHELGFSSLEATLVALTLRNSNAAALRARYQATRVTAFPQGGSSARRRRLACMTNNVCTAPIFAGAAGKFESCCPAFVGFVR